MLDTDAIRKDFPILERVVNGRPVVYLDNGATSQKPRQVIEAIRDYYERYNANVHRSAHTMAWEASVAMEEARAKVQRFINAPSHQEVVFTRNVTEAINLVAYTWGRVNLGPGDEVLITEMEHHSNVVPWQLIAQQTGAQLRYLHIRPDGTLDLDELDTLLSERTKLVSVVHVSNVLGTINPVREIAAAAHARGALMLVDAAQSVPHMPVDVRELDCDFLGFTGHKMMGPTGIGVLWAREALLEAMPPFLGGGSMISDVYADYSTWAELPHKFEAGTPNIEGAIALGVAVDYLSALGMNNVRAHERELTGYALERLGADPTLTIYGPRRADQRGGAVAFNLEGVHPHDLSTILDQQGVAIRAGHHCCQPLHRKLDVAATARASFYVYNTPEEVDQLADALVKAKELFGVAVR
jgi:cysteine desulfurase/selenocysteine lyase